MQNLRRTRGRFFALSLAGAMVFLTSCGSSDASKSLSPTPAGQIRAVAASTVVATVVPRHNFVGGFFRAQGPPPFGVFLPQSSGKAPVPYPTPGAILTGGNGYCDRIAANGASIDGSYQVDPTKLSNLIFLGARWTRLGADQSSIDGTHIFGPGQYAWGTLDSAQCATLAYHQILPVVDLVAGPVEYDSTPGTFSPTLVPMYQTAADFGAWCGAAAQHEKVTFPTVTKYSIPGSEVNTNTTAFPGGEAQVAAYTKACYAAIKAANPLAFVYGFELNMDGAANAAGFVKDEVGLGCKVGTCYDGISMHLSIRNFNASTPCYPNAGGDYDMQCVTDVQTAAQAPVHVLISETVYLVPNSYPDEQTKANAIVQEFTAYAANPTVDGVLYGNIDECAEYIGSFFAGGCLIDTSGNQLPGYGALQFLASQYFL